MKKEKRFTVWSVIFTVLASVCFDFIVLDVIYLFTLEQGLRSVVVAFGVLLIAFAWALFVFIFGSLGGVMSAVALRKQELKPLNITTFVVSASVVATTILMVVAFLILSVIVS